MPRTGRSERGKNSLQNLAVASSALTSVSRRNLSRGRITRPICSHGSRCWPTTNGQFSRRPRMRSGRSIISTVFSQGRMPARRGRQCNSAPLFLERPLVLLPKSESGQRGLTVREESEGDLVPCGREPVLLRPALMRCASATGHVCGYEQAWATCARLKTGAAIDTESSATLHGLVALARQIPKRSMWPLLPSIRA